MNSQWENFLKNLGEWQGSFTQVSLQGELLDSTPSILNLKQFEEDKAVRLRLRRFGPEGYHSPPIHTYQQDYRSLGRQIIFFDTGAFSKGSLQLAPYSQFGAEYGFVAQDRRLRFVQLYDLQGNFSSLTLIREFRSGTDAKERPRLTVDQLIGDWEGKAYTISSDWQEPTVHSSYLEIRKVGDGYLQTTLSFESQRIDTRAKIEENQLAVEGETPRTITLLPDGGSSNVPLKLPRHQPFFLEAGWWVARDERQRLIRHYNERGEWAGSTHVIERRVKSHLS